MSTGRDQDGRPEGDDVLLDDLRAGLRMPRAPAGFERRMHEAIDAGFLDPPVRRRRWPIVVAAAALAAAACVTAVLWLRPPPPAASDPSTWQMRGTGAPLAVEMSVMAVSADGESTRWLHPGDPVDGDAWLRFQVQSPPGVFLALTRRGADGSTELFYRWPEDDQTVDRVSRDGDVWYAIEGSAGDQTFTCVASETRLTRGRIAAALDGTLGDDVRVQLKSIAIQVE